MASQEFKGGERRRLTVCCDERINEAELWADGNVRGGSLGAYEKGVSGYEKFVFFATGFSSLFYWNAVLNVLYDLRDQIYYEYPSMTDTVTAVNCLGSLLTCVYTTYTGAMNMRMACWSGLLLGLLSLFTAVSVQWQSGLSGAVTLHIVSFLAGAFSAYLQAGVCALCSVYGDIGAGYFSAGNGGCGVVTFALWIVLQTLSVKQTMWIVMGMGAVATFASIAFFAHMIHRPETAERIREVQYALATERNNPLAPSYAAVFKATWVAAFAMFWCMFICLFIFPNIGPLQWNQERFENYIMGTFQVGDLVGRYLPALLPALLLSNAASLALSLLRTLLVPLSILCWYYPDNAFWNSRTFQLLLMALLALTNGWINSSTLVNGPLDLPQEEWRSRSINVIVLALMAGCSAGLWAARIFTYCALGQ